MRYNAYFIQKKNIQHTDTRTETDAYILGTHMYANTCTQIFGVAQLYTHTHTRHTTQTAPYTQPQIQTHSCMCTHGERLASTQLLPRADRCSSAITLSDSAVKNLHWTELSGWALIILNLTESPLQCAHSASELSREEGFKDSSDKDKKKRKKKKPWQL